MRSLSKQQFPLKAAHPVLLWADPQQSGVRQGHFIQVARLRSTAAGLTVLCWVSASCKRKLKELGARLGKASACPGLLASTCSSATQLSDGGGNLKLEGPGAGGVGLFPVQHLAPLDPQGPAGWWGGKREPEAGLEKLSSSPAPDHHL